MSLFNELKRRNVFKVAIAYGIVSWIVLQVGSIVFPALNLPDWTMTMLIVFTLIGFPFVMLFTWAFELTPEGIKPTKAVDQTESIRELTGQKINYLLVSGLAIALVLVVIDAYVLDGSPELELAESEIQTANIEETVTPTIEDVAIPEKSIAVLPFANLSSDAEQEYFSDGLSEELLNKLAQVRDLQVAGRTSSFFYKDKNEDLREIGETLGVAHLLEGSVRKSGNQLRITAQLIRAEDGFHLWSDTFDRELADIFAIQDEIAEAVTTALSITMRVGEFSQPGMTTSIAAYDEYLKAIKPFYEFTRESIPEALEHMETAVSLDPDFALAWLSLSSIYSSSGGLLYTAEESRNFDVRIEEAINNARNLAPEMPKLLREQAFDYVNQNNRIDAEKLLLEYLDVAGTSDADAALRYGNLLKSVGRREAGLRYLLQARRLNPLDSAISLALILDYIELGRTDEAYAEIERGVTLEGLDEFISGLGMFVAFQNGDSAETMVALEKMTTTLDINLTLIEYWLDENIEEALLEVRRVAAVEGQAPLVYMMLTRWAAVLGDPQLALDIRITNNDIDTIWAPNNQAMRRLPAFKNFVKEEGLVDYWRSTGNWADLCQPLPNSDDFECF